MSSSTSTFTIGPDAIPVSQSGAADDPPILWLHGSSEGAADASSWAWLVDDLGDHFHNVAPDLSAIDDLAGVTNAALGVLDQLGLARVAVVGHAAGGLVALWLAAETPDRISHVVLEGADAAPDALAAAGLSEDSLAAIAQPVTIVHGRDDPTAPVESARFFAERLGDAQLHVFPRAGHAVHLEQPQEFAILVRSFLREEEDELDPSS